MKHRRTGWTACMVVVTSLGIGGMLAGGCGGDDEAPAGSSGAGGAAGKGGSTGTSGTKAGGSGTGTAGTTAGGSGTADSGGDAPVACMPAKATPSAMEKAICQGGLIGDSGGTCLTNCFCTSCPKEAVACLGDPKCKAIVDCAAEKKCGSAMECLKPENCQAVIAANATGLAAATDFACCGGVCQAMCPAGDGGGMDASPDAPKADAPASDAPASDAPAETGSAADADNEGG